MAGNNAIGNDDDPFSSADLEFGEMSIADYNRCICDYKDQIEELELCLENTQIEMAEDSERCEDELKKMDELVHAIQRECTAEIEELKLTYEKQRIQVLEEANKKLREELKESEEQLLKEKRKTMMIDANKMNLSHMKSRINMNNEFAIIKEDLEQASEELRLANEKVINLEVEKEQLVRENHEHLERIDQTTLQMQCAKKEFEGEKTKLETRISELEQEINLLQSFKEKSDNSKKLVSVSSSSLRSTALSKSRQPSLRLSQATLRRQNSMNRRQKVLESSMKEMDDMITAMRKNARQRKKNTTPSSGKPPLPPLFT